MKNENESKTTNNVTIHDSILFQELNGTGAIKVLKEFIFLIMRNLNFETAKSYPSKSD